MNGRGWWHCESVMVEVPGPGYRINQKSAPALALSTNNTQHILLRRILGRRKTEMNKISAVRSNKKKANDYDLGCQC